MAVTRLSDLKIVPSIFTANVLLEMLELNAFYQSGIVVPDPDIVDFLTSNLGGESFNPRFFEPLATTDPNISTDDPDVKSTPEKITAIVNRAVRHSLNKSWSAMDLNTSMNGADPLGAVTTQVAQYWTNVAQIRTLQSLQGVIADNIATDAGDMVIDTTALTGADALFNPDSFIDAQTTMGDRQSLLTGIAVHSTVLGNMRKQNLTELIPSSDGTAPVEYYGTLPIIVDDGMTVTGTGADRKFYTYLFGRGAIAIGFGSPKVPFEEHRDPSAGNGGGQETLYSRVEMCLHPQGFECSLTPATVTPVNLMLGTSWKRAFARKRVPIACMITKG